MRRWLIRISLLLLALTGLAVFAAWLLLRASLPVLDGELALPGLSAPVTVRRDALGKVTGHRDGGETLAHVADALDFPVAPRQEHCEHRRQHRENDQGDDQHVVVRTGHVTGCRETPGTESPVYLFLIPSVVSA